MPRFQKNRGKVKSELVKYIAPGFSVLALIVPSTERNTSLLERGAIQPPLLPCAEHNKDSGLVLKQIVLQHNFQQYFYRHV